MKTEIENIIYNYADELKIGGQSESQIPHILIEGVSKCKIHFDNLIVWNNSLKKTISVLEFE